MKYLAIVLTAAMTLNCFLLQARAKAAVDLLTDAKAADVLSDLLTYSVDRTDASVNAMQAYLQHIGKADAYAKEKPTLAAPKRMAFSEIFKGAILFVSNGGDKYADPTLKDRGESELLDELTELQSYNMQQFIRLNQQRDACDSIRAYLKSIGEFDNYLKWANETMPGAIQPAVAAAGQPQPTTPQEAAARMEALTNYARSIAWKKAQARGMSEADFSRQWQERLAKYKQTVAEKVEGVRGLSGTLAKSEVAGANSQPTLTLGPGSVQQLGPLPPPAIWTAPPPPSVQAAPPLPTPVASPYSNEHFQQQNGLNAWNPWDGQFYDGGVPVGR